MHRIKFWRGDRSAELTCLQSIVERRNAYLEYLLGCSLVGSMQEVRAAKALLSKPATVFIDYQSHSGLRMYPGFKLAMRVQRLPQYNMSQLVIRSQEPRLLIGEKVAAVRGYLLSEHINTPVLPSWIEWLAGKLSEAGALKLLLNFGIEARLANFNSKGCDELVSEGIRGGFLKLEN